MEKKNFELAKQLRHELHAHPELSNHEVWTKNHLIEFLKKHTKLEIVDRGLWFYSVYKSEKGNKNIAFRADFDALPIDENLNIPHNSKIKGVSHKCGHDGHSSTLAGFALEIDQKGSDKNIFFLFQHAEETGDGAKEAAVFIKENNIDEIFAYHNKSGMPFKSINIINGTTNFASKGMLIHMEGVPSHASEPERGRNPSFAIAKIIDAIPELTASEKNKGEVLCTIIQVDIGERAFGVNASKGDLLLTIRAMYEDEMMILQKNIEDIAKAQAKKYGLNLSFEFYDEFPETSNHKESSDKVRKAAIAKDLNLLEMKKSSRGSEDFGHFLKETKGAMCYIGNGEDYPNVHTYEYDFPDELIEIASDLFMGLVELE
jgi:amidohydrolase